MDAMPTTAQPVEQTAAPEAQDTERIERKRMNILILPRRRDTDPEEQQEEIDLDELTLPQLIRRLFRMRVELADQEAYAKRVQAVLARDKARCESLFSAIKDRCRKWAYSHFAKGKKFAILPLTEAGLDDRKARIQCRTAQPTIAVVDEKKLQAHFLTGVQPDATVAGPYVWNPGHWSCDKAELNKMAKAKADELAKDEAKIAGMIETLREFAGAAGGNGDLYGLASLGLDEAECHAVISAHSVLFAAEESADRAIISKAIAEGMPVLHAAAVKAVRHEPLPGVTLDDQLDTVIISEEA